MPPQVRERREARKRRAYMAMLAVALLVVGALAVVQGYDDPFLQVVHPLIGATALALLVALWRRWASLRLVETVLYTVACLALLAALIEWRLDPRPDVSTLLWVTILLPLSLLALGRSRGLLACLGVLAAVLAITAPVVAADLRGVPEADGLAVVVLNAAGMHLVVVVLLWVLAIRYEHLILARTEAEFHAWQASVDPLTGLANRRRLTEELERATLHAHRQHEPLSVVSLDLDHIKDVNDAHGHAQGDAVLVEVAERLTAVTRRDELLGRWGGEEFLVVAPGADEEAALALASRCGEAIRGRAFAEVGVLTVSLGAATLAEGQGVEGLLRCADRGLYAAKDAGRDRVGRRCGAEVLTGLRA